MLLRSLKHERAAFLGLQIIDRAPSEMRFINMTQNIPTPVSPPIRQLSRRLFKSLLPEAISIALLRQAPIHGTR